MRALKASVELGFEFARNVRVLLQERGIGIPSMEPGATGGRFGVGEVSTPGLEICTRETRSADLQSAGRQGSL